MRPLDATKGDIVKRVTRPKPWHQTVRLARCRLDRKNADPLAPAQKKRPVIRSDTEEDGHDAPADPKKPKLSGQSSAEDHIGVGTHSGLAAPEEAGDEAVDDDDEESSDEEEEQQKTVKLCVCSHSGVRDIADPAREFSAEMFTKKQPIASTSRCNWAEGAP